MIKDKDIAVDSGFNQNMELYKRAMRRFEKAAEENNVLVSGQKEENTSVKLR